MSWASATVALDFFFFQAEDGIRAFHVTGVQTCALPIYPEPGGSRYHPWWPPQSPTTADPPEAVRRRPEPHARSSPPAGPEPYGRSEERRVGKECRSRSAPETREKKESAPSVHSDSSRHV